jgi:hypothetical protein
MAGIDNSELLDDEAANYFADGESVAPTATKTDYHSPASIDANTLRERIGRNRKDVLREVFSVGYSSSCASYSIGDRLESTMH